MCGIAGIIHRRPEDIRRDRLKAAARALRHRGPDDCGVVVHGRVGLAHTRLSIIDLAGGHQPIESADDRLSLVANGEIYNYLELFAGWESRGRKLKTRSDSEAILHAYAEGGADGMKALNGMFAFALHERPSDTLILGRDRLGIKPLFYAIQPEFVAFSSEIKGLLALLPNTPELNPSALVRYLENKSSSGEDTIFRGVRRVPPGCCLTISADLSLRLHRYWRATDVLPQKMTQGEAEELFDNLMAQVMKEHMRSDVPFGLFLSGGVDSATVCALLHRYQAGPVQTYSVGYKGIERRNELQDAARIAGMFGARHEELLLDSDTLFHRIPHMIYAADELMLDNAALPTSLLAERASRDLKVVFTGEGGDEVFAGYGRYRRTGIQRFFAGLIAPGSGGFRTRSRWQSALRKKLFSSALLSSGGDWRTPFIESWQKSPTCWSSLQRAQFTDIETELADDLLVKVDRSLMSFGLEGRVPFLDHRVVEFGLALPDSLKVKGRVGKLFLRRWALKYLPKEHLFQTKKGFHAPVAGFFSPAVLQQLASFLPRNRAVREFFNPSAICEMIQEHIAGKRQWTGKLWALMHFAIWHRMFVEEPTLIPGLSEDPLQWLE
jgi:asparagine synthase (glutamine-hydrolysing)